MKIFKKIIKSIRDESVIHDPVDKDFMIKKKFNYFFHPFLRNAGKLIGFLLIIGLINTPPHNLLLLSCLVLGIVLCLMMIFTRHGLLINPRKKRYIHLILLFGIPLGAENTYQAIEKLYINRNHGVYCCYIKLQSGKKFLFDHSDDKNDLLERILKDNLKIETDIYDQTYNPNDPIRIS